MSLLFRLAWRNLWRNRRRTLISAGSVGAGLAFMIISICVGEGMQRQMTDQGVRMIAGHLNFQHPKLADSPGPDWQVRLSGPALSRLAARPEVALVKPLVLGSGLAATAHGATGVALLGVDPRVEAVISPLARAVNRGKFLAPGDDGLVVLGQEAAKRLHLAVGKKLVVTVSRPDGQLMSKLFRVGGVFATGSQETDSGTLFLTLAATRELLGLPPDAYTRVGLLLKNPDAAENLAKELAPLAQAAGAVLLGWREVLPEMAGYIRLKRNSNLVMWGLLVALVLFTIANTLLMSALEREPEFALLAVLGTSPGLLMGSLALETALYAAAGSLIGLALGGGASLYLAEVGLDMSRLAPQGLNVAGYMMEPRMYAAMDPAQVFGAVGGVFLATFLLGLLPLRRVARAGRRVNLSRPL